MGKSRRGQFEALTCESKPEIMMLDEVPTFPIEATNSDIRYRIDRFHRRSKVTWRSVDMLNTTLKLFHHLQYKKTGTRSASTGVFLTM